MKRAASIDGQTILRDCIAAAVLAPSSHNTQPWRFRQLRDQLDLIADRTRALPANDPSDRELIISCGAALFNFRVAAAARSWTAMVEEFPFADDEDLIARISLFTTTAPDISDAAQLDAAIPLRRTVRKRFHDEPVEQSIIDALVFAAEQEHCFAAPITGSVRREAAADLIAQADQIEWADPVWRREMSSWMHPQRRNDGFGVPGLSRLAGQLVARTFDLGAGVAAHDRQILEGTPLLFVIGSPADQESDWLRAGQALERVLLTACSRGLQASYLNQPLHIASSRAAIRDLAPDALLPQVLLRLGRPMDETPASARRPTQDIFAADPLEG